MSRVINFLLVYCLVATTIFCGDQPASAQRGTTKSRTFFQAQHAELRTKLIEQLAEVVAYCDDRGFKEPADRIRSIIQGENTGSLVSRGLPVGIQVEIAPSVPAAERYWQVQLRRAQQEYASKLYLLSRRVLKAGHPSYAYQIVRQVAQHDPDHRSARALLGYERYGNEWVTPFAASMMRKRKVWHERFGWLPKSHVDRYEGGERFSKRGWVSAAKEIELRSDFRNAWEVETDHFLVKTNHSLERGVEIANALEDFHQYFYQTFASFFNTPDQMLALFEGVQGSRRRRAKPHEVHFYRSRQEYIDRLVKKVPQIAITNGLYLQTDRVAYFFHNPDPEANSDATVFHEATHQLFYESQPRQRGIAVQGDFWIVEGIACYMESFVRHQDGSTSIGDPNYIRFQAARYRLLKENYYVPLGNFRQIGMRDFQNHPEIRKNYSQASGLSQFLMDFDNGIYRDALVTHLTDLYNTRRVVPPRSLARIIGTSFDELDAQYIAFSRKLASPRD